MVPFKSSNINKLRPFKKSSVTFQGDCKGRNKLFANSDLAKEKRAVFQGG